MKKMQKKIVIKRKAGRDNSFEIKTKSSALREYEENIKKKYDKKNFEYLDHEYSSDDGDHSGSSNGKTTEILQSPVKKKSKENWSPKICEPAAFVQNVDAIRIDKSLKDTNADQQLYQEERCNNQEQSLEEEEKSDVKSLLSDAEEESNHSRLSESTNKFNDNQSSSEEGDRSESGEYSEDGDSNDEVGSSEEEENLDDGDHTSDSDGSRYKNENDRFQSTKNFKNAPLRHSTSLEKIEESKASKSKADAQTKNDLQRDNKEKTMTKNNDGKPRKEKQNWKKDETLALIAVLQERNITALMDSGKMSHSQIFDGLQSAFNELGFNRRSDQMLQRYRTLRKNFKEAKVALDRSGEGAEAFKKFKYFAEMQELLQHRPVHNLKGIDSCDPKKLRAAAKNLSGEGNNNESEVKVKKYKPKTRKEVLEEVLDTTASKISETEDDRLQKVMTFTRERDTENMARLGNLITANTDRMLVGIRDIVKQVYSSPVPPSPNLQYIPPSPYQYPGWPLPPHAYGPPNQNSK